MNEIAEIFEVGDYVVCRNHGICQVQNITTLDFSVVDRKKEFYVLHPMLEKDGVVYVGVDSHQTSIRHLISKEQALNLIDRIKDIGTLWVSDEKQREQHYKDCVRSCECEGWVKIIKTIYQRQNKRILEGKKTTSIDSRYFKLAEDNLYEELSIALKIPMHQVKDYIAERIEE